jgi:flagellar basal body-associated protein FliL
VPRPVAALPLLLLLLLLVVVVLLLSSAAAAAAAADDDDAHEKQKAPSLAGRWVEQLPPHVVDAGRRRDE